MRLNLRNVSRVAIRALITNKTRSVLTTLGIIIGVMAVILLVSIGSGLEKLITQQFEDLGTNLLFVKLSPMLFGPQSKRQKPLSN